MLTDYTTLQDLSIFGKGDNEVFEKLSLTLTVKGKQQLQQDFNTPLDDVEKIKEIQQAIKYIGTHLNNWDTYISNGSLMVVEKFLETAVNPLPSRPNNYTAFSYKLFSGSDFSLTKYSIKHCFDFIKGMQLLVKKLHSDEVPQILKMHLVHAESLLNRQEFEIILQKKESEELTQAQMLGLAWFLKHQFKRPLILLMEIYARLDAWYGMARAVKKYDLCFPEITETKWPFIEVKGLYHLLLKKPVAYDVSLNEKQNFLFLTGANMAGKSTFIKAMGIALFLAHLGMGVPAKNMQLSLMHGLLSNINVLDNISKGESYFYNEVKRIKTTVGIINTDKKWFILIDELFKGTNVQDAMKCSSAVIEGLVKVKQSLFILSTHLYEIADELKRFPNIQFKYFETDVKDDQLHFTYKLNEGVSNDRLGYLILKRENVVNMLNDL